MTARVIDGTAIAAEIRSAAMPGVEAFARAAGRPPGLGIVLVGENPASEVYVRNKAKAGGNAGLFSAIVGGWVRGAAGSVPVTRAIEGV